MKKGRNEKPPQPSDADRTLFRRSLANINPADKYAGRAQSTPQEMETIGRGREPTKAGAMIDKSRDEYIEVARAGLQKRTMQKLKRGGYEINEILDLHGHTTREAEKMLADFLAEVMKLDVKTVLIIHGKGLHSGGVGVLKHHTVDWLKRQPQVKAFCSTVPKHGGTGAVYVLL